MPTPRTTRRSFLKLGGVALGTALANTPTNWLWRRAYGAAAPPTLTGQVILPASPEYYEARLTFNTRFSHFPAAIVRCARTLDVQNAIRWARDQDIPVRARSGGHSYEAFSVVDGGLVIDVSPLNGISLDLTTGEAVVGAGVRLQELYQALRPYGVTIPTGTCPLVGIAGITLGGGIGLLARQYGLTCDNLLAVELVDANGDVLHVSATENDDLFWALRGGGGGNFGIATAFTFQVRPIGTVVTHSQTWPRHQMATVLDAWQGWAPYVDARLTSSLFLSREGDVSSAGLFTGSEIELDALLGPFLAAAPPAISALDATDFVDYMVPAGTPAPHATFKNTSTLAYAPISAAGIAILVEHLNQALPPGANLVQLFPFGGAIAEVDPSATAFVHRRALFDLQYQAYWWDPAHEAAHVDWIREIRTAMLPHMGGAYVNYIDADIDDWANEYYGSNLPRLSLTNAKYDPDDIFNHPQSIPR